MAQQCTVTNVPRGLREVGTIGLRSACSFYSALDCCTTLSRLVCLSEATFDVVFSFCSSFTSLLTANTEMYLSIIIETLGDLIN